MQADQIVYVLGKLQAMSDINNLYRINEWIPAEAFISAIVLSSNESVYPDSTMQVKFNNVDSLLMLKKSNNDADITYIEYGLITAIVLNKSTSRKSPYKTGNTV